jgi:hypothetical protein
MPTDADMPGPTARAGDVTMEAGRNIEQHLGSLAALRDVCASIDQRLAHVEAAVQRTEDTLHRREGIVAEWLQELSARMTARLVETEETIQRIERERVDETWRLTQQSLADSKLPEMCVNIERQLVQARMELQRIEEAAANKTLHELCQNIDARLGRTEDTLHRNEGIITEWLQELSADMTARCAEAEEAIQRIERIISSGTVEQTLSQQPSVQTDRPIAQPWMARLAVSVSVLVVVLAIAAQIKTSRDVTPDNVVPLTTSDQVLDPVEQATNQEIRAASTTTLVPDAAGSTRESRTSAPQQRSPDRRPARTTSRAPRFAGTLSITSVPSGASVSINGKPAGVTPLRLPRQRAGSLAVQVAHDGFERWSAAVLVPADQLTQVTAKLRAAR